ncbi:hypothetical protein FZI85_14215 [Mycobacterium sp. CBMA293]|uniref:hypothetical protein n=1 Tax=unclassified Mycolicibacterium TaxID=2636767 RepID=UPI0012DC2FC6|nr:MULTISPECIES: hypothetical protein [unclassified Mycolicibacterium]MUL48177.1 hypothetical protein [Mycolicibacterium sp. CBMA 360]MUL57654.1 hypothetical protein [Mycolicibacterium sp. CBMA 335]MUL70694.1 hypothetical protein [Mycolicibacterium sp. CBMA 311]MUL92742.1 hypothetical protein [Mycolicibacterium sp. CBMA 230]MUM08243.1 hypothetical protein [Mycolicibacterium sp. CBMA 213]
MTATAPTPLPADPPAARLRDAAFGNDPGRWPLPTARTADERWLRAVAAGGQGRYAVAFADLDAAMRQARGPLLSLAHSTRASFLRQLGWHDVARVADGRAWALVADQPEAGEARADALVGLAADALGVGRFGVAQRLLERAETATNESGLPRQQVRLAWVSAELAMVSGRGEASAAHAERAVELVGAVGSPRHAVKTDVVYAAALCSAGRFDESRRVADAALSLAQQFGLVPLTWALGCLLSDIGSAEHNPDAMALIRDTAAATVRARGGQWAR